MFPFCLVLFIIMGNGQFPNSISRYNTWMADFFLFIRNENNFSCPYDAFLPWCKILNVFHYTILVYHPSQYNEVKLVSDVKASLAIIYDEISSIYYLSPFIKTILQTLFLTGNITNVNQPYFNKKHHILFPFKWHN